MDMSPAALPPHAPSISDAWLSHPRFRDYREYRYSCTRLMIDADSFPDWLAQREAEAVRDAAARHPEYHNFVAWMRETQAGRRKCSAGNSFPDNFNFWLTGGRW